MISAASYRAWVEEYLEEPEKRRLALRALAAFEGLEKATSASISDIAPVLDAVRSRYVRVWEIGADLLNRLATTHQEAQEAIVALLLQEKQAAIRFHAIALLGRSCIPRALAAHLIQLGLRDKSNEVRGKVAEAACQLGLSEVIPALEEALVVEKHPIARQAIEFSVALLRDGYLLQREHGKLTSVWVKKDRGRGYCISVPLTDDDFNSGRLASIVADAKSRP